MALNNCAIESMNKFLGNIFYIPNYQREYSWEESELSDFWDDLMTTKDNTDDLDHFFGQIVIHNDEGQRKKFIIDGQQRTITSTIFMRTLQYLYDVIYKDTNLVRADYKKSDITSMHIGRYLSPTKNELHLHLGELDEDYFRENIQLGTPENIPKAKKKSHERLRKAYVFFYEHLKAQLGQLPDVEERLDLLDEYYDTFVKSFSVLYMEASKLEEAFIIFETLNARGRELETADLLKNFIFSQSKDIESAKSQWNAMVNTLDHADTTKYIRHYWNATRKFTREKDLYKTISKGVTTPRASRELLKSLAQMAQCYHDISAPNENTGFADEALVNSLQALKTLKASAFYPVVLAAKQAPTAFKESDIRTIVQTIETYVFRNFTICGKVANKSEVFFAEIAKEIYDGTLNTVNMVVDCIRAEMIGDKEFQQMFEVWMGSKATKETVRYILRKVHRFLDSTHEINIDNTEVHIEHIMPDDNSEWCVPDDIHEAYLWRLGNLALLSGPLNISISNKPFEQKKEVYKQSKIEPNKMIADNDVWTEAEIESRQKQLAQYALQIWRK